MAPLLLLPSPAPPMELGKLSSHRFLLRIVSPAPSTLSHSICHITRGIVGQHRGFAHLLCPGVTGQRSAYKGGRQVRATSVSACASPSASPEDSVGKVKRRLILLRHAKSSWEDPSLRDHDRPLSVRGRKAAKRIAERLQEEVWMPELILCSDSLRTRETLLHMREAVPALDAVPVRFLGSYYSVAAMDGQTAVHLQETVVTFASNAITTVLCMGHNRGWEEAASEFTREPIELKTAHGALLISDREHRDWATAFADGCWTLHQVLKPDIH